MTDAFDANVLIRALSPGPTALVDRATLDGATARIGSVILLPEVLTRPLRRGDRSELEGLTEILAGFDLKEVDAEIADASVTLGAKYGLKAADAIHLATAVVWGAERFYTHNTKDFGPRISEIEVVVPG